MGGNASFLRKKKAAKKPAPKKAAPKKVKKVEEPKKIRKKFVGRDRTNALGPNEK